MKLRAKKKLKKNRCKCGGKLKTTMNPKDAQTRNQEGLLFTESKRVNCNKCDYVAHTFKNTNLILN